MYNDGYCPIRLKSDAQKFDSMKFLVLCYTLYTENLDGPTTSIQ